MTSIIYIKIFLYTLIFTGIVSSEKEYRFYEQFDAGIRKAKSYDLWSYDYKMPKKRILPDDSSYRPIRFFGPRSQMPNNKERYLDSDVLNDNYFNSPVFKKSKMNFHTRKANQITCERKTIYQYTTRDVKLLLSTINRIVTFWENYFHLVIIDGLFGLRVAEGKILEMLKRMSTSHRYYDDVSYLYNRIKQINEKIYLVLIKQNRRYTQSFLKVVDKPFIFSRSWRKYEPKLIKSINQSKCS